MVEYIKLGIRLAFGGHFTMPSIGSLINFRGEVSLTVTGTLEVGIKTTPTFTTGGLEKD